MNFVYEKMKTYQLFNVKVLSLEIIQVDLKYGIINCSHCEDIVA
jgi:formylmethanofuran dehydrogenase subunit E